jgi:hypothetical protein
LSNCSQKENALKNSYHPLLMCVLMLAACQAPMPASEAVSPAISALGIEPCKLPALTTPAYVGRPQGTSGIVPQPPAYPYPAANNEAITDQAKCISAAFERYVTAWLDGRVPSEIPSAFLPPGVNLKDFPRWRLVKPTDIAAQDQWGVREAHPIDPQRAMGFFPDPHVTYVVLPAMYLPFGHRVVVQGQFPHARFFNLQVTPSFDPASYHYDGGIGVGEVPLVDADIEPLPGHTNPYRVGANRQATQRSYRAVFKMAVGDPVKLNAAFRPPYFRDSTSKSNERIGGAILFQGPWGVKGSSGHGRGLWDVGQLWIRYYRPDAVKGALGGVPLPKVHYETPEGRQYFVAPDIKPFADRANQRIALSPTPALEPPPNRPYNASIGWFKQVGIFRAVIGGVAQNTNLAGQEYVRLLDKGVAGRGFDLAPPNNYEQSATSATYVDYLVRGMSLGNDKVVVLTGKLPTFPATRNSDPVMRAAQMRYWSLTAYEVPSGWEIIRTLFGSTRPIGLETHAILDEDVVLDNQRRYVIALSRAKERPLNATAQNGVTWVDWGPSSEISWTLRWLTVGPEWTHSSAPTPQKLGSRADWASADFDPRVISTNHHNGAMAEYLPRVHYLTRAEFERLGNAVSMDRIPLWQK